MATPYIIIVYQGPPDFGRLRGASRDLGATRLAVHVDASGASIYDTRANGRRTNSPKIWTLDEIDKALAEYERLFYGLRDPYIRCIWLAASTELSLLDSLEARVVKLDDIKKQETSTKLTPYEKAAALLGLKD